MEYESSFSDVSHYDTPKRKVLFDISNGSPVSPMANLKLLTKVATSPSVLDTPVSYGDVKNCDCSNNCNDACQNLVSRKTFECGYIRRTKSLSVLCEKFLLLFPLNLGDDQPRSISIKHMAADLGVEKRRVYDIVNIVECLDMAKRFAKDSYLWYGNKDVPQKITLLYHYACGVGLDKMVAKYFSKQSNSDEKVVLPLNLFSVDERRIGVLCQKFVMLLLVCGKKIPVTLDMAGVLLIGGNESSKTKSRRLYDISNMLMTLGIVSRLKPDDADNPFKKPAFIYSGPAFDVECGSRNIGNDCSSISEFVDLTDEASSDGSNSDKNHLSMKYESDKEPVAKKRLVFNQDTKDVIFKTVPENVIHKRFDLKTFKPLQSIVIQRPVVKLEPGSFYKAIKVGGSMQLVKINK